MNIERMEQIVRVLHEVSAKHKRFSLSTWHMDGPCGTTCCAIGWAAEDSWHQAQGLGNCFVADYHTFPVGMPVFANAEGIELSGFAAAAEYLDITYEMTQELFSVVYYKPAYGFSEIRPEDVIAKINKYLLPEKAKSEAKPEPKNEDIFIFPQAEFVPQPPIYVDELV